MPSGPLKGILQARTRLREVMEVGRDFPLLRVGSSEIQEALSLLDLSSSSSYGW